MNKIPSPVILNLFYKFKKGNKYSSLKRYKRN